MKSTRSTEVLIVALFALAGFLLTEGIVAAWQMPMPEAQVPQEPLAPLSLASSSDISLNWSGYVAGGNHTYTAVSGAWQVPQVDTSQNTSLMADATWVGIGGVSERDLIQAGTQAITDESGEIIYQPWIETIPGTSHTVPMDIKPGDTVRVDIAELSPGMWRVSLANETTGKSYATTIAHDSSRSSAEWIEEMPALAEAGLFIPLDYFGSVSFTGGSAVEDGTQVSIAGSGAEDLSMATSQGEPLAAPTALGSDGASFSVARLSTISTAAFFMERRRH